MNRLRLICAVSAVCLLASAGSALAINSIVVESKTVSSGDLGVPIHAKLTNDVALAGVDIPLEIRSTSGGAFISSLRLDFAERILSAVWPVKIARVFADPDGTTCSPNGYHTMTWTGDGITFPVAASPEGVHLAAFEAFGSDQDLPAGADVTGSLVITVDVAAPSGTFEIDTTCIDPSSHFGFYDATGPFFVPGFTKGVITVTGNQAPVLSPIGPKQVDEGQNFGMGISATDPDGTTPTLTAQDVPANASFTDNGDGTGVFLFNPTYSQAGVYYVRFIASDGFLTDEEVVEITVLDVSQGMCFEASQILPVSSFPVAVVAADLDGDGDADLVAAFGSGQTGSVGVWKNNGDETFVAAGGYPAGNGTTNAICAADLDGDGDVDLAVTNNYKQGTIAADVAILKNNGDGTFGAPVSYDGGSPVSICAADFDGDGDIDLASANSNTLGDNVSVRSNNGDGTFAVPVDFVGGGSGLRCVVTADLDGDGDQDLVTANSSSNDVSVLKNNGSGIFATTGNYMVGSSPLSVIPADLDGDGDKDLAVANSGGNHVSVLRNIGDGTFGAMGDLPAGDDPRSIFAADLDGDGDMDLAVANYGSSDVTVLKNTGGFAFGSPTNYPSDSGAYCVFAADMDGDGDVDLAVANRGAETEGFSNILLLMNAGNGAFADFYRGESYSTCVFAADLDGDSDADIAVTKFGSGKVSVLKNHGGGSFAREVSYACGDRPESVFAADLDSDGDADLAVANSGLPGTPDVSVLKNNGDGTFAAAVHYTVGVSPRSVFAADLDGDGDADLAVANGDYLVSVLKNNGNGTFAAAVNYQTASGAPSVFAADLDGDGDRDLAVANYSSNEVSVLKNNGDGTFAAAVHYTAGNAPKSIFAADLDGDGDRDLATANFGGFVSVLKNNGDGTFGAAVNYAAGESPASVFAADLDGDGDIDLAVANYQSNDVSVLKNNGDATYATAVNYAFIDADPSGQLSSVFAADLDGDGDADLAVPSYYDYSVVVILNVGGADCGTPACACNCHADPICDAVRSNVQDVVATINVAFRGAAAIPDPNGACPYETTDMNCDGFTSVVDVVKVVNVAFRGANATTEFCNPCP